MNRVKQLFWDENVSRGHCPRPKFADLILERFSFILNHYGVDLYEVDSDFIVKNTIPLDMVESYWTVSDDPLNLVETETKRVELEKLTVRDFQHTEDKHIEPTKFTVALFTEYLLERITDPSIVNEVYYKSPTFYTNFKEVSYDRRNLLSYFTRRPEEETYVWFVFSTLLATDVDFS